MFHSLSWAFHSILGVRSSALSQSCTVYLNLPVLPAFRVAPRVSRGRADSAHHSQLLLHIFVPMARATGPSTIRVVPFPLSKASCLTDVTGLVLETAMAEKVSLKDTRTRNYTLKVELLTVHAEHDELLITVSLYKSRIIFPPKL